jgi:hypothetical protein
VTPQLLLAMEALTDAGSDTLVRKLCRLEEGQPHGLSSYSAADRRLIVEVLDAMCQCVARAGGASRRKESGASELLHKPEFSTHAIAGTSSGTVILLFWRTETHHLELPSMERADCLSVITSADATGRPKRSVQTYRP